MIIVSDTSSITALLQVGKIDLLRRLYAEVLIPEAVRDELNVLHSVLPSFITSHSAVNRAEVTRFEAELDLGEAEAIVLAKELRADLLLIDEEQGREVAVREGLEVIGLLGVLIQASRTGLVPSLREVLGELENKTTFRLSQSLKNIALERAGEL